MYNHTGLQGRLTADPELRYTQQGTAITSFTLASDTGRKTKDGKKITNFIECVAWRAQAEFVCKYLSKGRLVLVEGELTSRSYEDKDGNRRKAVEITVDSVHFCDSKKDGGQSSGSDFADPGYTRPSSPSSKRAPASRSTRATSAGSSARLSCPCSLPSTTASTTSAGRRSSAMRGARCWTPSASGRT